MGKEYEKEDYSKYVKGWEENYGRVLGETLKIMAMGKYFKNCNIDEKELYDITFYYNKEDWKDILGYMNKCYFSIKDLSDKVFYVYYNTSSRFACEQQNIHFEEEEEEEEEEEYLNKAKDFSKYVEGWKESYGLIDGGTLKVLIMGKFFKKCDIDEDEEYKITYYYNKEENDNDYWIDCFFSIKNLSKKVFNVYYNTDSSFAYERRSFPQLNYSYTIF